jgi:hypothetical protein
LFDDPGDAFRRASLASDVATSTVHGVATHVGATQPRLGVFVVDTGGGPRVVVGPVARAFERLLPANGRMTDMDARQLRPPLAAWEKSYLAPGMPPPALSFEPRGDEVIVWGEARTDRRGIR